MSANYNVPNIAHSTALTPMITVLPWANGVDIAGKVRMIHCNANGSYRFRFGTEELNLFMLGGRSYPYSPTQIVSDNLGAAVPGTALTVFN